MPDEIPFEPPAAYVPPPPEGPVRTLCALHFRDPVRWLGLGWQDLRAHPGIAAFYGAAFWLMAMVLGAVFRARPEYSMSIASGCLLVGPFLALGLYQVSRQRDLGLPPSLWDSLGCWRGHMRSMAMLVLVLVVLELLWGRMSLVVFAVFFNTGMPSTSSVMQAVFNPKNWEFIVAYAIVGGAFAGVVFAVSVVSIPMILDRDTDAIFAAITSIEVVVHHTAVMLCWGLLITAITTAALMLPNALGLWLAGPWLGHASWHAYRGAVRWPETVL